MTAASAAAQSEPTTFRELLAAEVRAHLARQRLSNRRFARMLGLQPTWIDRRLNGTTPMTADDIELFANALHLTPQELMSGAFQPRGGVFTEVITREYPTATRSVTRTLALVPALEPDDQHVDARYGSCPPGAGNSESRTVPAVSRTVNNAHAA